MQGLRGSVFRGVFEGGVSRCPRGRLMGAVQVRRRPGAGMLDADLRRGLRPGAGPVGSGGLGGACGVEGGCRSVWGVDAGIDY